MEPTLFIDLDTIAGNARTAAQWFRAHKVEVYGVTKACLGAPQVAMAMLDGGCRGIADSRWQNLRRLRQAGITARLMLIRSPGLSQVDAAVRWADVSLNTELNVVEALSRAAVAQGKVHGVILMVEAGDLREGKDPAAVASLAKACSRLPGIRILGVGSNVGCYAASGPSPETLAALERAVAAVRSILRSPLEVVSGGNSGLLFRSSSTSPTITQARVGEAILLGADPVENEPLERLSQNAFTLVAEVIEVGPKLLLADGSQVNQALLPLGTQDLGAGSLTSCNRDLRILGMTSDHLVVDVGGTESSQNGVAVGDRFQFWPNYQALVSLMTSPFIDKVYGSPSD